MKSRKERRGLLPRRQVDWSTAGACGHAVQFYANDGHLLELLARFVGTALVGGDAALVVATKAHRDGLIKRLQANGLDAGVAREQGRFVALDADSTLAEISRNGQVNRLLFQQLAGDLLHRFAGRRIVVFGEMVALLWAQGHADSAILLEQLWNELATRYDFSLCCAYPIEGFGDGHAAPFMKICAQHSHVFTVARTGPGAPTSESR